jgi:hypothetical protein
MTGKEFKACENHYEYLIRMKRLPELTKGGCAITEQDINSNWTEVMAHPQSRWHNLIDSIWDDLRCFNKASSGCAMCPSRDFDILHPYF